ncbi:hypothetical protein ACS0TY_009910 [Phlomoides rotata]
MDMSLIARKLGISDSKLLTRKAAELRRLADIQFDSSIIGVGETCKAVICLEIAASRNKLDIKALAIQFGCVRLIPFVHRGLSLYKDRFLASLPPSRRSSTDFSRPVFTAVAFYLCAKKQKLKVDKFKLIELAGTSETEYSNVSTSMLDLCFDAFGISREKKDSKQIKGNRELIDALPEKRRLEDGGYSSSDGEEPSAYKKRKQMEKCDQDEWKSAVLKSNKRSNSEAAAKINKSKQTTLDFLKRVPETTADAS